MSPGNIIAEHENRNVADHASLFGINSVIMSILHSRGYDTSESIDSFLNASLADMHSPFMLKGMHQAVTRVRKAINARERIGIFADSDLDGITSLAVLHNLFNRMKIEPFLRYLKDDENYGITLDIINEFKDNGVSLIITVDSGTRDVAEIAYARSLGIDVIVTDHHEQDKELPDAIIINPKIHDSCYPFKHLAGVGVAFKLSHAILMSYLPSFNRLFLIIAGTENEYALSLVRDCVIEKIVHAQSNGGLESLIKSVDSEAIILVYDNEVAKKLKNTFTDKRILDFIGFIAGIANTEAGTIDDICRKLSIKRTVYHTAIDLLNKIFMEIQLAGSEKVKEYIESVMGLVAIGSIADVINLTGENRILVSAGIHNLSKTKHQALSLIIKGEKIDSRFIGWTIAPLLNTPGRLGKTDLTVGFFIENDTRRLQSILSEIKTMNESRRLFVKQFCGRILEDISKGTLYSDGRLIHIKTDEIPEGYAGLIANRIADVTGKPVIVTVLPGKNGIVKGSGRSRGGLQFFSYFGKFTERFERIGGHENAFGFTAKAEEVDEIISLIEQAIGEYEIPSDENEIDSELDIACINARFINELQLLEPYGYGNREPVFITRRVQFESFLQFGNNHGKYMISDSNPLTTIGWGMGLKMKDLFESGKPLDIVFRLENNNYNGKVTPRMIINDIKISPV